MTRLLLALAAAALLAASAASMIAASPSTSGAPSTASAPLQESAPVMFRFNQVGYVQSLPKRALAMTRRPPASRRYAVLDARGHVVARGTATGPTRWNARYRVYTLDFGRVTTTGLYRLQFAGHRSSQIRI